ncbi:hypothetical protein [Streptomyces afghaniensis]|uniref:hypothetical protein n=1 Tax=Streptomyces afghaniensis TaxID=66865 RepID=UPI00278851CD|nr:hypothetical protein [Streptomyces afghaniensis]MDQ1018937.1 hypothetical protein [Streptomyces afghaniensis]
MSTLAWRTPDKQDRRLLQTFTCAEERPPKGRPAFWEDEVQKYFRQEALADTNRSPSLDQRFRIAEDAMGIAAAYTHARPEGLHPDLRVSPGQACRYLLMLGVALRHRHQGGKVADELLIDALYDIAEREPNRESVVVLARVDWRNIPSQNMLSRWGFEEVIRGSAAERLGWWMLILER